MENKTDKPRLVFFQWRHDSLPMFLRLHLQLHVKCLSESFDVIVINKDCDYSEICDTYRPDLALFESGYKTSISQRIKIKNTASHPEIPKLGLHNGDPWCDCRVGFISDMAQWGIETFFTISTTTAEHTPEIADNLFVWANFIDIEIYRDYRQDKIIPILFNGNTSSVYPWRQSIQKLVTRCYPSLSFPHLGYESYSPIMIHGEQYARTLNGSYFVPACGTIAKEIIRKHFEIPGSRSCLITEESPALKAAGFIDMENCVFADENNVLDKINYLFNKKEVLSAITDAGYELVQSRHTLKQRDQIFQWYTLYKKLKYNERIVQLSPFQPLCIVEKSSGIKSAHVTGNGLHLALLKMGDEKLLAGQYDEAESCYLKCLNFIHWMSEPKLKLAICNLYRGQVKDALNWILTPIQNNLSIYQASNPDPVEWAYLIRCLLCQGNLSASIIRANQFDSLYHPELDRIRWVVSYLQHRKDSISFLDLTSAKSKYSIHQLPVLDFKSWMNDLCVMLKSCQQYHYLEELNSVTFKNDALLPLKNEDARESRIKKWFLIIRISGLKKLNNIFEVLHVPKRKTGLPSASEIDYLIRLSKLARIDLLRNALSNSISAFKKYRSSQPNSLLADQKKDEYFQDVKFLFQQEEIKTVLMIASSRNVSGIASSLLNLRSNISTIASSENVKFHCIYLDENNPEAAELHEYSKKINSETNMNNFDLVLIDSINVVPDERRIEMYDGNFIVINGINGLAGYRNKQKLISEGSYIILIENLNYNNGYVIFRKIDRRTLPRINMHIE